MHQLDRVPGQLEEYAVAVTNLDRRDRDAMYIQKKNTKDCPASTARKKKKKPLPASSCVNPGMADATKEHIESGINPSHTPSEWDVNPPSHTRRVSIAAPSDEFD